MEGTRKRTRPKPKRHKWKAPGNGHGRYQSGTDERRPEMDMAGTKAAQMKGAQNGVGTTKACRNQRIPRRSAPQAPTALGPSGSRARPGRTTQTRTLRPGGASPRRLARHPAQRSRGLLISLMCRGPISCRIDRRVPDRSSSGGGAGTA